MKSSLQLLPHQTTWSLGRVHYLATFQPQELSNLDQQNKLVEHLMEFNRQAQQTLNKKMLQWSDPDALILAEKAMFPQMKIPPKRQQMPEQQLQEIKNRLGITPEVEKYLLKLHKEMHRDDD